MTLSPNLDHEWRDSMRAELSDLIKTGPAQYAGDLERIDRLFDEGEASDMQTVKAIQALAEAGFLSWHSRLSDFAASLVDGQDDGDDKDDDGYGNDGAPVVTAEMTEDGQSRIYHCGDGFSWVRLRDYNLLLARLRELERGTGGSI